MLFTRILLAHDHAIVAEGLESLLRKNFDLVGVVHDGRALVEAAGKLCLDVIVTDISTPGSMDWMPPAKSGHASRLPK